MRSNYRGTVSELEMHRADYQACKAAGFESPGELLAAYKMAVNENRRLTLALNGLGKHPEECTAKAEEGGACVSHLAYEELHGILMEFAGYFTSGNSVPVERATIRADSVPVKMMKAAFADYQWEK